MTAYPREATVTVHSFSRQEEGEDVIIGRVDTGVFLAVSPDAVEVLEQLAQGKSVGEVADNYQQKHGAALDLDDFLRNMEQKGIIIPAEAGIQKESNRKGTGSGLRYHFANFPQGLARRIYGWQALYGYALIFFLAVGCLIYRPSLIPRPRDLYFPDHRTLTWTLLIGLSYGGLFAHELGHLIAARALGINSRMGISHRLWYLVVETDLTGLWSQPKRRRYLPLLAGVITDVVSGSLTLLLLFAHAQRWLVLPILLERLARAMAFTYLMRILWQCFLFVRTDFYYVIAAAFNCRSLLGDTQDFLRNVLSRILPWVRPVDQSGIPARERKVIQVYSLVWVLGRIGAVCLLWMVTVPVLLRYSRAVAEVVRAGYFANPGKFIDALVLALYFLVPLALGLTLWIRGLARAERT